MAFYIKQQKNKQENKMAMKKTAKAPMKKAKAPAEKAGMTAAQKKLPPFIQAAMAKKKKK